MSGKELVLEWIREIPDSWSVESVIDALAIRAELRLAQDDIDAGRVFSHEQMKQEVAAWNTALLGRGAHETP
jgi:hypothetical protein